MEAKLLLRQLWDTQGHKNESKNPACRFQLQTEGGPPVEYTVCSSAVLLDYAPTAKLEPGKLYTVEHLPLKKLDDFARVNPDVFLSEESIVINQDTYLQEYFLPLNNKGAEHGLGIFHVHDGKAVLKDILPYQKDGSFQFAGLGFFQIPEPVQLLINNNSSMTALNARICKVRSNPAMAVVLSCDTGMLVVTLSRLSRTDPANENIYFNEGDTEHFRLDGYREDLGVFSRLVKAKNNMKTLANPMQRKAAVPVQPSEAAPESAPAPAPETADPTPVVEPQVEEVKPEQAEQIAAQAPEATKKEEAPAASVEEPKKRTRAKRQPVTATLASVKSIDELIAYLGTPIPDGMSSEAMQEEVRKLRDLGVVVARRQSNLYTAATAAEKKLRDTLRGVLG